MTSSTINFGVLSDTDIAEIGLDAAEASFRRDVAAGLTNGDSLVIVVGHVDDDGWYELGQRHFGLNAQQFVANISPDDGKLATALIYEADSVAAYQKHGGTIPEGPQRYTGGVHHTARVLTKDQGWLERVFAGAASGVQGHLDMATVYAALTHMGAAWALKMQELYGKG